jgi:hypothetical protein
LDLLRREVPASSLVIAIDPGKALNRVWLTTGERGLIGEPVSLPVLRDGVEELQRLVHQSGVEGPPVIGLEGNWGSASSVGSGDRAALAGIASTVRAVGDDRRALSAWIAAVQDRRPRLRSDDLAVAPRRRPARRIRRGRGAARDGSSSPPARRRAQEASASPA